MLPVRLTKLDLLETGSIVKDVVYESYCLGNNDISLREDYKGANPLYD